MTQEPANQEQATTPNRAYRRAAARGKVPTNIGDNQDIVIRKPECRRITGLSDSAIRDRELAGEFPKRLRLGGNACGWLLSEVNEWLQQRAADR